MHKEVIEKIVNILKKFPQKWDAKKSILEMKNEGFKQWKQMEWIGWYFEFLCQKYFKGIMQFHKVKYGNTSFDGFLEIPFDFKAHVLKPKKNDVIINDSQAFYKAIEDYGSVIILIALGEAIYNDINRSFQNWIEQIKGGKSKYEMERIKRNAKSRLRKKEFNLKEMVLIKVNKSTLEQFGSFQKNFRNADGSLRNPKYLLTLEELKDDEIIGKIEFV